jgi:hypothetical protein
MVLYFFKSSALVKVFPCKSCVAIFLRTCPALVSTMIAAKDVKLDGYSAMLLLMK